MAAPSRPGRGTWRNQPMSDHLATSTPLIWANRGAAKDRPPLVQLTPDALTLAAVPRADVECVIAALREGGDVAGQVIPLASLSGASGDDDSAHLTVSFRTGPSREEFQAIAFVDKAKREDRKSGVEGKRVEW